MKYWNWLTSVAAPNVIARSPIALPYRITTTGYASRLLVCYIALLAFMLIFHDFA